jgi:hypothetical protein
VTDFRFVRERVKHFDLGKQRPLGTGTCSVVPVAAIGMALVTTYLDLLERIQKILTAPACFG